MKKHAFAAAGVGCLLLGVSLLLLGCATGGDPYFQGTISHANVYVAPVAAPIHKVAIMPFKAPTELIGSSVSDLFVTEMLRAGRYELVERSQMAKVLSESELALAGLSAEKAVQVGNMLGADGVIIGTVDEYTAVAQRGRTLPTVGCSVRLIDCKSGKVMWSVDIAKKADSADITLAEHSRSVVHEMTAGLYQKWDVQRQVARAEPEPAEVAAAEEEAPQEAVGMTAEEPPEAPAGFELSDMGLREVALSWGEAPAGASRYRIERAAAADGPFESIAEVSARAGEYCDAGSRAEPLADNTSYYYRLVALSASGLESKSSEVRESMTAGAPEPPANLKAETPAARAVRLKWEASTSDGVEKYVVERALASQASEWTQAGETEGTTFEEGGTAESPLSDSTKYQYRVASVNRVQAVGEPSRPLPVTTRPPPKAVGGLLAGNGQVRCVPLKWTASAEEDVVRYDVYRSDSRDGEFVRVGSVKGRTTTTHLDGGQDPGDLQDAREYFYSLRAVNAVTAESASAPAVNAITRSPPPVVEGVLAESGRPREVLVSWQRSPDAKVIGYIVSRASAGSDVFVGTADIQGLDTTKYLDRGGAKRPNDLGQLADRTEYKYRVMAFNTAHAKSEWSAVAAATTKPHPVATTGAAATTNLPKSITISWSANPESDIREYVIEASADGERFKEMRREPGKSGVVPATDEKGLRDGVTRHYRIRALDKDLLYGDWSKTVTGRTKPLPGAPTDLKAELTDSGARLTWSAPTAPDVQRYRIWKKGFMGAAEMGSSETTEYSISAGQLGKGLSIVVTSVDADGLESERTAPVDVRPPAAAK